MYFCTRIRQMTSFKRSVPSKKDRDLAQLVAHTSGGREVAGSSPVIPTERETEVIDCQSLPFSLITFLITFWKSITFHANNFSLIYVQDFKYFLYLCTQNQNATRYEETVYAISHDADNHSRGTRQTSNHTWRCFAYEIHGYSYGL